ncbi:MAG: YfhO family protein [Cyanobacteria bacterium]|nr:YfhO family protein [Cyanobacteriota bacterium]
MAVAAILVLLLALFWKTVFLGQAISKIHLIAEWDSIFRQFSSGKSYSIDPSLVLLMVPYYFLVSHLWHSGTIPLWNPYSGFGGPLLADPQSLAFSPLHFPLYIWPSMRIYNLILVGELVILAVGAYVMARACRLNSVCSLFTALALVLCPYEQWYLELLGNGYCILPWVFAAFLFAARSSVLAGSVVAGLACAMLVLSSHPELSFCGITTASLLLLAMRCSRHAELGGYAKPLKESLVTLVVAGTIAFGLSAPMLLPFVEYLANSQSYKFSSGAPAVIPWQTLMLNMIQPGFSGASPFFGVVAFIFLVVAVSIALIPTKDQEGRRRRVETIIILSLTAIGTVIAAKLFFLQTLLLHAPLRYLVVTYFFPSVLILVALLAGIGCERALMFANLKPGKEAATDDEKLPASTVSIPVLIAMVLSVVALWSFRPLANGLSLNLRVANFDMTLPDMSLASRDWLTGALIGTGALVVLVVSSLLSRRTAQFPRYGAIVAVLICVGLNVTSQALIAKHSLPIRPDFSYPTTSTIRSLREPTKETARAGRILAIGDHLLKPSTNQVYSLRDIRQHNPLFPKRYVDFIQQSGASLDEFNQNYSASLSRVLNLASVDMVLTADALVTKKTASDGSENASNAETDGDHGSTFSRICWLPGLESQLTDCKIDPETRSIQAQLNWRHQKVGKGLVYFFTLLDKSHSVLWISDRQPVKLNRRKASRNSSLGGQDKSNSFLQHNFRIAVPLPASSGESDEVTLTLSLFDFEKGVFIEPSNCSLLNKSVVLVTLPTSATSDRNSFDRRFSLVSETEDRFRIYRNNDSLPNAYLVHKFFVVKNGEEALNKISSSDFDQSSEAVLEAPLDKKNELEKISSTWAQKASQAHSDKVRITRRAANSVSMSVTAAGPGLLVLTDTWYPGWKATVDGHATAIHRANFVFRGIMIDKGKHSVEFSFMPLSLLCGVALAGAAIALSVVLTILQLRQNRSPHTHQTVHKLD